MDRRAFTLGSGALLLSACAVRAEAERDFRADLAALERKAGGRLGVFILHSGSGESVGWRQGERFGMCSTFKLSLAAYLLREGDAGRLNLNEVLPYTAADLVSNSPVTRANVSKGGMTIAALAEATQMTSDNAAANLLLRRIGGPATITGFWRELGDKTSRVDRYEPEMNNVPPGEVRDTVTPEGIARSAAKFVLGDVLRPESRARLADWMARTETGQRRIRAGIPADWRGGDKTGTGGRPGVASMYNDIAVIGPADGRAPLVVAAFYQADAYYKDMRPQDEAVLKQVGELAVQWAA